VRTYATRAAYGPILVFKFHPNRNQNRSSTGCRYANTPKVSQVRSTRLGMLALRGYLIVGAVLLVVKAIQLSHG
jgi:hypothetical protein